MDGSGTVGGRYALDGRLGEGGMGQVYRARHLQLGKAFALKIISPAFAGDQRRAHAVQPGSEARERDLAPEHRERSSTSARTRQFGAYMVMELVEGEPLSPPARCRCRVKRAIDVLAQVADALDHIHKRGIVHGDVKADNIMLTAENEATRRGAGRRAPARLRARAASRGGEAEERRQRQPALPRARARRGWSAERRRATSTRSACSATCCLTGTLPFDGNVVEILMAHIHDPIERRSRRGAARRSTTRSRSLILRALAKDPAHRHG